MRIAKTAACLAVLPMLIAASEPVHLQPSSKWVVDYADDSCRLLRTFGPADDQSIMLMERVAPSGPTSLLVVSKSLKTTVGARDFTARFLPHEKVRALHGQSATSDDKKPAVLWSNASLANYYEEGDKDMPPEIRERLEAAKKGERLPPPPESFRAIQRAQLLSNAAATTGIEISRRGSRTVVLDTGPMLAPISMLKQCAEKQLTHWGIDPKVDDKITKPVYAVAPETWFRSSDYPEKSLSTFNESQLSVRLLVDAKGAITKCTPVTRVSASDFPARVCEVMGKRARFEPAELADGTKVPSYYIQTIHFRMADR